MFIGKQNTIANKVSCSGKTAHDTCPMSTITFLPAEANTGIIFKRTDLKKNNEIKAVYKNIKRDGRVGITLANKFGVEVFNIEHVMSAIWGQAIDNLIVEVDCPEVPITDGSTEPLLFLLKSAGHKELKEQRKVLEIKKEIKVKSDKGEISIKPLKSFIINMALNSKSGEELNESFTFDYSTSPYKDTISRARSFYLENDGKIIDEEDYRHSAEFARHEILDCIGSLFLSGYFKLGEINCVNGDYDLYSDLLEAIFESEDNYGIV